MLVTEQFLKGLIKKYGKHSISTDDGGLGIHHKHVNS
jgi:hypothetical protein